MNRTQAVVPPSSIAAIRLWRVGCVSFLNAKPLIEGLETTASEQTTVHYDVPSRLLADLEQRRVDIALCPIIDYFRSGVPLEIIPAGAIGCEGTTLTVKLFSRVPIEQIDLVHADTDSHTSVALLQVIFGERYGRLPRMLDLESERRPSQAMLLIGDKVVTNAPDADEYIHQMDLGEAWHDMTRLPFVFAVWMARRGEALGELPALLDACRARNQRRLGDIAASHAASHGWPTDLALHYYADLLRYDFGPHQMEAVETFARLAQRHGLISTPRPLCIRTRP